MNVAHLNLLKVAPGGHVGRFCIWTESAFRRLDDIYGTYKQKSTTKVDFGLVLFYIYQSLKKRISYRKRTCDDPNNTIFRMNNIDSNTIINWNISYPILNLITDSIETFYEQFSLIIFNI